LASTVKDSLLVALQEYRPGVGGGSGDGNGKDNKGKSKGKGKDRGAVHDNDDNGDSHDSDDDADDEDDSRCKSSRNTCRRTGPRRKIVNVCHVSHQNVEPELYSLFSLSEIAAAVFK
jgi:hypothetical protein